jgi:hypothetical protein
MEAVRLCRMFCLIMLCLALASTAGATDLTFFLGGAVPGKLRLDLASNPGQTYQDLAKGPIFGLRLNNSLLPVLGLEHTLAFSTNYLTPKMILNPKDARGFVYNTNLLVNIPVKKFIPYGTMGIGLIRQYGSPDAPIGTKLAFNYGGGIKFARLAGPIGLRFDIRGYRAMKIMFLSSKESLNILEASVGLMLSFGR